MGLLPPEEGLPPPDDGREFGREFGLPPPEDDESGLEDDDDPKGLPVTVSQYAIAQPVTLIVAVPSPRHGLRVEHLGSKSVQESAGARPARPGPGFYTAELEELLRQQSYAIRNQRRTSKNSLDLWIPELVLYGIRLLA